MEGELICYRCGQFNNGHVTEVDSAMIVRGGQFNGGTMVMLWRWPV